MDFLWTYTEGVEGDDVESAKRAPRFFTINRRNHRRGLSSEWGTAIWSIIKVVNYSY